MKPICTLQVSFLAGTSILEACTKAKSLATNLDLAYVTFSFNNIKCSVGPNCDLETVFEEFSAAQERSGNFLIIP